MVNFQYSLTAAANKNGLLSAGRRWLTRKALFLVNNEEYTPTANTNQAETIHLDYCPTCGGAGEVWWTTEEYDEVFDRTFSYPVHELCPACDGTGMVEVQL